jgi:hypothetical protein
LKKRGKNEKQQQKDFALKIFPDERSGRKILPRCQEIGKKEENKLFFRESFFFLDKSEQKNVEE